MKKKFALISAAVSAAFLQLPAHAANFAPCPFNAAQNCTLYKDILNDVDGAGLRYYGPTNYDHRFSGEIEIFDANLVQPYTDGVNAPGQIKLVANLANGMWKSGEIMTRINLDKPPYNSPKPIHALTTNDITHGYIEAKVRLPRCEVSDDGLCQNGTNPAEYVRGLWPSIWFLPTMDTNWPQNGEIDIFEAYQRTQPLTTTTAALHFNGNSPRCGGNDCKFIGYHLPGGVSANGPIFNDFHTWGFEWQPDPNSTGGGVLITGYFDNVKLWGPMATDSLPVDGPAAFRRGFHDPNGGFYFIAAVAVGGGYAGPPNSHLRSATMYIQSVKAYSVGDTPVELGPVTLNFAAGLPTQCSGAKDTLTVGTNNALFTIGTAPFTYQTPVGGPFAVKLASTAAPIPVAGGSCKGTLNAAQVNVPGQLTATYAFTATPVEEKGTIQVSSSAQSDARCNSAGDTFFLDQNPTGTSFPVLGGISQLVVTGMHQVRLASLVSIPAGNNQAGFCTSTLDMTQVNVLANQTAKITATYKYNEETPGMGCTITSAKVTQQSDWGSQGLVNMFEIKFNLQGFPKDGNGRTLLDATFTNKNNFVQNFWGNFNMTSSSTAQNVGKFKGEVWSSTGFSLGGFINNKTTPLKVGDNPLQSMVINGVMCK